MKRKMSRYLILLPYKMLETAFERILGKFPDLKNSLLMIFQLFAWER